MNRPRRSRALAMLVVPAALTFVVVSAQSRSVQEKKVADQPAETWLLDRALTVHPAAAPVPSLKYRLYPAGPERKEGNAAPIYLRFAHTRSEAWKKETHEKPAEWNKLPLDRLPMEEVKKLLDGYSYNFKQLELGARRKTADWSYTFDAGNPINLRLPDVNEMRMQAPLLLLKARVETAEGRFADAVRTLETGISFSQQVSDAPLLISALVGLACAGQVADGLQDLIEREGAPNLYWALAVIPRPLIDFRRANEIEYHLLSMQFPDLDDLDRPRTPREWDGALKRIRTEFERVMQGESGFKPAPEGRRPADPASKSPDLPAARKYLADVARLPAARLEKMPPAEVLLRYISHHHRVLRDEVFKGTYLPYTQSRPVLAEADKRLKAGPESEAAWMTRVFLPAILKVQTAQVRVERRLALLQAVEALRMHAAANGGKLPGKLSEVKVVPVPLDPGTNAPFGYALDGDTATLTSRLPGEPLLTTGLRYRLTVKK
jgi:hypothetical protein